MIEKPAAGWVVQVTTPGQPSPTRSGRLKDVLGAPSFEYFNVAIAAPEKAVDATTEHLAEDKAREARTVRPLSPSEIASLKLKAGDVAPA